MTKTHASNKNTPLQEIKRIFEIQKANQFNIADTTAKERIAKLRKLEQALFKYQQEIRNAMYADFRKPTIEVDMVEIFFVLSEIRHAIRHIRRWMAPQRVPTPLTLFGGRSYIQYEPKGVVLIISPWNYPVNLTLGPLVSAIAAGNCAILKPSELTPHTSAVLVKIVRENFNENEVTLLEGDVEVSKALLDMPFNHIFFTGSPQVGKIVMQAAAKNLASVTLELGGKSPTIVDESANLDIAARRITWIKYTNNGQTCIAPDYVLVHESRKEEFLTLLKSYIRQFFGENAAATNDYARVVSHKHFDRVKGYLIDAEKKGAQVEIGGQTKEDQRFIAPLVLTNVPEDAAIMEGEIFGPLLPVITFRNLQEAIDIINKKERPLALYIFSKNNRNIRFVSEHTRSGAIGINHNGVHYFNNDLPFGGVNNSGVGKGHGWFGFEAFSNAKGVFRQVLPSPLELLMPPYTAFKQKLINLVLKWL